MKSIIWDNFKGFISTNDIPGEHKILISILVVFSFSTIIFVLSWFLKILRKDDILKIQKYNIKNFIVWSSGAMLLQFILISTKIINYNILSFLIIAMVWDKLYQKLFNKVKEKEITGLDTLENE